MKEIMMLVGFGMGVVTGAMLYKYSQGMKKVVDQTEKKVVKEAKKAEKQAEKGMENLEKKVKEGMNKTESKSQNS